MSENPKQVEPSFINYPRDPMRKRQVSLDSIGQAISLFQSDPKPYVIASVPILLLTVLTYIIQFGQGAMNLEPFTAAYWTAVGTSQVFGLLVWLVTYFAVAGMVKLALAQLRGMPAGDWREVYNFGNKVWYLIGSAILVYLATMVGLIGCLVGALFVAGLLFLTPAFIVDKDLDSVAAMQASMQAMRSNVLMAAVLAFVTALIYGFSPCCLGVGLLFGLPIYALTIAVQYHELVD